MSYGQSVDELQREVKSELQEFRRDETEAHMIISRSERDATNLSFAVSPRWKTMRYVLDVFVSIHGLIKSYNQYC